MAKLFSQIAFGTCFYESLRPWDFMNDVVQYEMDYQVMTKTRHRTPIVRATSITSVEDSPNLSGPLVRAPVPRLKRPSLKWAAQQQASESSTPDHDAISQRHGSESSDSGGKRSAFCMYL